MGRQLLVQSLVLALLLTASCSTSPAGKTEATHIAQVHTPSPTTAPTHVPTPTPTPTVRAAATPSPATTLTTSAEGADGAYLTCCVRVWDGFVAVLDAIATAGEAADTDVFCEAQTGWGSTVHELRASHAQCPKPADPGLVDASSLLEIALEELEQATVLYGEFCRTQHLNLADDANQQLQQAVTHAGQAYEALTGQPFVASTLGDVNLAFAECVGDVIMDLWNLFDDIESAPEAHSLMEFCAPVGGWATKLAGIQAKYDLCTPPTDPCLLTTQEPLEALLAELSAAFQHYEEACAEEDDSLVEEGTRHLFDALAYAEQASDAIQGCGGE